MSERIQIGWLCAAIEDEGDIEGFVARECYGGFGPDVESIDHYEADTEIHHSHGPVTKPLPVFIEWPPLTQEGQK